MDGQAPGRDGLPGNYRYIDMKDIELYYVASDVSETLNVASEHPDVVEKIKLLANGIRAELGDKLQGMPSGSGSRPPGRATVTQ